jgi:Fic family protein
LTSLFYLLKVNLLILHWLRYFLTGMDETARQASKTLSEIVELKKNIESTSHSTAGKRTRSALVLLTHLFKEPVISVKQAEGICDLSKKAANDLVGLFIRQGILKEISGKTRYRLFLFAPYLNLFK